MKDIGHYDRPKRVVLKGQAMPVEHEREIWQEKGFRRKDFRESLFKEPPPGSQLHDGAAPCWDACNDAIVKLFIQTTEKQLLLEYFPSGQGVFRRVNIHALSVGIRKPIR